MATVKRSIMGISDAEIERLVKKYNAYLKELEAVNIKEENARKRAAEIKKIYDKGNYNPKDERRLLTELDKARKDIGSHNAKLTRIGYEFDGFINQLKAKGIYNIVHNNITYKPKTYFSQPL